METENDKKRGCYPEGSILKDGKCVLPEVNFTSLIMSLSSSALCLLGEIPDPSTQQKRKDLVLAKHTIDTLNLLKEKTKGNLNSEEQGLLDNMLYDLKMLYVKVER